MTKKGIIIISSIAALTISLGTVSIAIAANNGVFKEKEYCSVSFDTRGGSSISSVKVIKGKKVQKPTDPTLLGYHLLEWDDKEGKEWNFKTDIVKENMTLYASWEVTKYSITYNFNGGSSVGNYPTSYTIESDLTIDRPTKEDNIFSGWFSKDGIRIDSIKPGMTGNLFLTARWLDNLFVQSTDTSRGEIHVFSSGYLEDEITVVNVSKNKKYHTFLGFYDENDNLLSKENSFTFKMDEEKDYYIYPKYMNDTQEEEWNDSHYVNPAVSGDGKYVMYGLYPQTNVNDVELIQTLDTLVPTDFNGYYCYNHEYYAKTVARLAARTTNEPVYIHNFDNGNEFNEGDECWFKVEPIKWRVLDDTNNGKLILSERVLEHLTFNPNDYVPATIDGKTIYSNYYANSNARHWLNNEFYDNAFAFNISHIQTTEVNNSIDTIPSHIEGYDSPNVQDKVFPLSFKDYTNEAYGFNSDSSASSKRHFLTTDYVRTRHVLYEDEVDGKSQLYAAYCLTRSPIQKGDDPHLEICKVNRKGVLNNTSFSDSSLGVQPALNIKL